MTVLFVIVVVLQLVEFTSIHLLNITFAVGHSCPGSISKVSGSEELPNKCLGS